ncbi:hypothetical protein [Ensifer sp. 1H6]|uniref:hypothetical protein n=1 Tax=Ensifer sp. 1H6 TaxID=1911585 RepID=UPI0009CFB749|nr:hypothetical protein [Ensifer sp. 1H6]OMQ44918.1 hypothetical protein BKP54_11025 [Ensifer sp. 1H6]
MSMQYLSQFESIGDNCEFGLMQHAHGIYDGGLLKWSKINDVEHLIELLKNDFRHAFRYENLAPVHDDMVIDLRSQILFHSKLGSTSHGGVRIWNERRESDRRTIFNKEQAKHKHLLRKFRDTAARGQRIFIFKSNDGLTQRQEERLLLALRTLGPARLMIVEKAENCQAIGRVELLSEGFMKGYIERFAPYGEADKCVPGAWERLCEKALRIVNEPNLCMVG